MLHIFFDDIIFHTQPNGGIARYVRELSKALAETGLCQVTLFAGWSRADFPDSFKKIEGLTVIHRKRPPHLKINSFAEALSKLWRRQVFARLAKETPSIIYHASYYPVDEKIAKQANGVVITIHDMIPELFFTGGKYSIKHLSNRIQSSYLAEVILAVSESSKNDLIRFHPWSKNKISVTYEGSSIKVLFEHLEPRFKQIKNIKYFLMVGNRDGYKNGLNALKSFCEFFNQYGSKDVYLVLCGGKQLSVEETELLQSAKVFDRVIVVQANDDELAYLYSNAIALLYPSLYEGFGLPVLEAMQCKCPVITSKCSSFPEVGGDAVFYADPLDIQSISSAMSQITNDSNLRNNLISLGIERAHQFTWERCARETIKVPSQR